MYVYRLATVSYAFVTLLRHLAMGGGGWGGGCRWRAYPGEISASNSTCHGFCVIRSRGFFVVGSPYSLSDILVPSLVHQGADPVISLKRGRVRRSSMTSRTFGSGYETTPPAQLGGLRERCKLPQRGLGLRPSRQRFFIISNEIYGRLNTCLMRSISSAILTRIVPS